VYTLLAIEFASTFMTISDICHWFGSGFGNIQLSAVDTPMLGSFVAAAVASL
jgi:hypothetical protein